MRSFTSFSLVSLLCTSLAQAQNPTPYCTAGVTSNFCAAQIGATQQPDVANSAGCVISVSGVPGNRQGLVFYGVDNSGFTPSVWGGGSSSSYLCVKAPILRLGAPQNSGGTQGACDGSYVVDWSTFQAANPSALGNPWAIGDKVFAQSWYRDPLAPKASNLSNALELTFVAAPLVCSATTIPGLVAIPAGTFVMGSNAANASPYFNSPAQMPAHPVTLSYCFWIGAREVTQAEYFALVGENPSYFAGATNPVEQVTWVRARYYCTLLTAQQSALGNVPTGYEYRLPTEAEWEYACRAGATTEFSLGADLFCNQARFSWSLHSNSSCGSSNPLPVASFAPNAWGLYDMHGNVAEWCLDSFAPYAAGPATDPFVTGGPDHVARGGSWFTLSNHCRSASRFVISAGSTSDIGFRVVLAPILVP